MPPQFREGVAAASFGRDGDGVDDSFPRQRLSQQRDDPKIQRAPDML
jgi:hypothetical protein